MLEVIRVLSSLKMMVFKYVLRAAIDNANSLAKDGVDKNNSFVGI